MADTFTVSFDDKEAQAALAELARRGADMTELMGKWAGHLADAAEESFATERSPDGVPWVELSKFTIAAREKRGHWPGQKLQVSGVLAASVTTRIGSDWAEIGSNVPYARIQQKGGKAGRGHKVSIPARSYLGVSDDAMRAIEADAIAWLDLSAKTGTP